MSTTAASGDMLVTIKVNHNGRLCRFKLHLRDMTAATLEDKLRACLGIDPSTKCTLERFSDSASDYVFLDRTNVPVYKQLYRAAKAKQKLKIKVTTPTTKEVASATTSRTPANITQAESEPQPGDKQSEAKPSPPPKVVGDEQESTESSIPIATLDPIHPSEITESPKVDSASANSGDFPSAARPDHSQTMPYYNTPNCPPGVAEVGYYEYIRMAGMRPSHQQQKSAQEGKQLEETSPPARPAKELIVHSPFVPDSQPLATASPTDRPAFSVCCNNCDAAIPVAHYHCSTCDDGDFDLCPSCVDAGITCHSEDHWLIKRFMQGGQIINSTTQKISPKPKPKPEPQADEPKQSERALAPFVLPPAPRLVPSTCQNPFPMRIVPIIDESSHFAPTRTCNCCLEENLEHLFVHCTVCDDYDLCKQCFVKDDAHGHHPGHAFQPAVDSEVVEPLVKIRLGPGRNRRHSAICDGCDIPISGVRHKCLDCPDWDYCSECVTSASFIHEGHRFVPVYGTIRSNIPKTVHMGICCDGPLCRNLGNHQYIKGIRYKCTVCHDTDFCGNCEASPANSHNKTHPLIKLKTPVRTVTVTTTGDKRSGEPLFIMGDRTRSSTSSRATATYSNISSTPVQTLIDVKPAEPTHEQKTNESSKKESTSGHTNEEPGAVFISDSVADGTTMPPNYVFKQTWTLRNSGKVVWPTNCSVRYVGGDYMGHIDPHHPTGVHDLISANKSTICYQPVEPGKEFSFDVLLRTPPRAGKAVSYWRLTTPDGCGFGHRLWCDVEVVEEKSKEKDNTQNSEEGKNEASPSESLMIFPKLEKESPIASVHEDARPQPTLTKQEQIGDSDLEELAEDDEDWAAESESLLTDDEYDLINASDEEYCDIMEKNNK